MLQCQARMLELPHAARHAVHGLRHACMEACTLYGAAERRAACLADAPQVIAQQVHNHQVLGAVLLGGQQPCGGSRIRRRVCATRRRALDRARLQAAVPLAAQEALRRRAAHLLVQRQPSESAKWRPQTVTSRQNSRREASACTAAACKREIKAAPLKPLHVCTSGAPPAAPPPQKPGTPHRAPR